MSSLKPNILYNQFVLGQVERQDLPEWRHHSENGWVLQTHPTLPVIQLRDRTGLAAGWLLGFPLAAAGLLRDGSIVHLTSDDPVAGCEDYLDGLAGRWLAIVLAAGQGRVYLDPSGSLAAVYSLEEGVVCSTPSVIGKGPEAEDWDGALVRSLPDLWYPFTLTPHRSLRRLLPNHYLDLECWQVVRHWPSAAVVTLTDDVEAVVGAAVDKLSRIVAAAVRAGAYMTLTAGFDTRLLLACSRAVAPEAIYFTSTASRLDVQTARELARRLHLHHVVVTERKATRAEKEQRLYLSGYTTEIKSHGSTGEHKRSLQQGRLQVAGNGGHLGRDSAGTGEGLPVEATSILRQMDVPLIPAAVAEAAAWIDALPVAGEDHVRDLMWLELRLGCKTGPQLYGFDFMTLPVIDGYAQRELIRLMMAVPYDYRKSCGLFTDLCRQAWPETLEVPINRAWGATRLAMYPERVGKKLRSTYRSWRTPGARS